MPNDDALNSTVAERAFSLRVVVVTAGASTTLEATLRSILACRRPPQLRGIVVVENGPERHAEALVQALASSALGGGLPIRYEHVVRSGKSLALNHAIDLLDERELVVMTDDDVVVDPGWLEAYAAAAGTHPEGYFFGGSFGVLREVEPAPQIADWLPRSAIGSDLPEGVVSEPVYLGFNWAVWVKDLRACGGFDPNIGPGGRLCNSGDETEVQRCLLSLGFSGRNVPAARVDHRVPAHKITPAWLRSRYLHFGRHLAYRTRRYEPLSEQAITAAKVAFAGWIGRLRLGLGRLRGRAQSFKSVRDIEIARGYREGLAFANRSPARAVHQLQSSFK